MKFKRAYFLLVVIPILVILMFLSSLVPAFAGDYDATALATKYGEPQVTPWDSPYREEMLCYGEASNVLCIPTRLLLKSYTGPTATSPAEAYPGIEPTLVAYPGIEDMSVEANIEIYQDAGTGGLEAIPTPTMVRMVLTRGNKGGER